MNPISFAATCYKTASALELIEASAAAGYDHVGLRLSRSPHLPFTPIAGDPAKMREVKAALAANGITPFDVLTFYLLPDTNVEELAPILDFAAEIGAKYGMAIGADPDHARMLGNFERLCDRAATVGFGISVEFMPGRSPGTPAEAAALMKEAGRANGYICVDPMHLINAGGTAADVKAFDRKLLPYAQINDAVKGANGWTEYAPIGEGGLPLRDIMAALPAGIPLSVEHPKPDDHPATVGEWAKFTADKTRAFLTTLGAG